MGTITSPETPMLLLFVVFTTVIYMLGSGWGVDDISRRRSRRRGGSFILNEAANDGPQVPWSNWRPGEADPDYNL